jgi:hypothetical protein
MLLLEVLLGHLPLPAQGRPFEEDIILPPSLSIDAALGSSRGDTSGALSHSFRWGLALNAL